MSYPLYVSATSPVSSNRIDRFYVFGADDGVTNMTLKTISVAGVIGPTQWTVPSSAAITAGAIALDELTAFYARHGNNRPISRCTLNGDGTTTALADLVAAVDGVGWGSDLLMLADSTLLATRQSPITTSGWHAVQINATTGATITTYTPVGTSGTSDPRICTGVDDPDSFWMMTFPVGSQYSRFTQFRVSDAEILNNFDALQQQPGTPASLDNVPVAVIAQFMSAFAALIADEPGGPVRITRTCLWGLTLTSVQLAITPWSPAVVGSVVVDILKNGVSIVSATPPTIVAGTTYTDASLTGWTTTFVKGDVVTFVITSTADCQNVLVTLNGSTSIDTEPFGQSQSCPLFALPDIVPVCDDEGSIPPDDEMEPCVSPPGVSAAGDSLLVEGSVQGAVTGMAPCASPTGGSTEGDPLVDF